MPKILVSQDIHADCPCGKSRIEKTHAKMKQWIRLHKKYCNMFGDVTDADISFKKVKATTGEQYDSRILVMTPEEAEKKAQKFNPECITRF